MHIYAYTHVCVCIPPLSYEPLKTILKAVLFCI